MEEGAWAEAGDRHQSWMLDGGLELEQMLAAFPTKGVGEKFSHQ